MLTVALPLIAALWTAVALFFGAPAAWMAIIAAADASLLMHLLRVPDGPARVAMALAFLLLCTAASLWFIAAGIVGPAFGLDPLSSGLRMGPVLFEMVSAPWWTASFVAWFAAAVALSVWWNR